MTGIIVLIVLCIIIVIVLVSNRPASTKEKTDSPEELSLVDKMYKETEQELQSSPEEHQLKPDMDAEYVEYLKELRKVPTQQKKDKSQLNFDFQHALFLNDSGRSEEAFQLMKQTADAGHTRAQFNTGVFYAQGHGVEQDFGMAVLYYSMAAMLGDRDACYNLGLLFYLGQGVEQPDYVKAVSYFTTAAQLEDYLAMAALSYCYKKGKGVEKDENKGEEWEKAALETPGSNIFSVKKVWEVLDLGDPSKISYSE